MKEVTVTVFSFLTSTNRFLKKSMNNNFFPKNLTMMSLVGLFCWNAPLMAQDNSIAYVSVNTTAYESPFEHMLDGYKEVIYEEGMAAKLEDRTNLILEDIFFSFGEDQIRSDARSVLDDLVRILRENPDLAIELSAHTDSRGSQRANERLSRNRARNMVKYLTLQGIEASRLLPIGSGEGSLRNHCGDGIVCSDQEHQENRRIEMKTARIVGGLPYRDYIYKNKH